MVILGNALGHQRLQFIALLVGQPRQWLSEFAFCQLVAHHRIGYDYFVLHVEIGLVAGVGVSVDGNEMLIAHTCDKRGYSRAQTFCLNGLPIEQQLVVGGYLQLHQLVFADIDLQGLLVCAESPQVANRQKQQVENKQPLRRLERAVIPF